MRRMMKEDIFDDPQSWAQSTWDKDQERLQVLENRVKDYLLDIEKRYKVRLLLWPNHHKQISTIYFI